MAELGISMSDAQAQQQEAQAALRELGFEYEDFEGKPRKMGAILGELRNKTEGLSKEQRLATLQAIFGTEAATGWLAVLDAGPETLDKLVTEMENCDGEAEKMAATMMNNAKGAWTQFKSAMEGVAISFGSIFLPAITAGMKGMADAAGKASAWIKDNEGLVKSIAELAGGIAAAAGIFKVYRLAAAAFDYAHKSAQLFFRGTVLGQKMAMAAAQGTARAMPALRAAFSADTYRSMGTQAAGGFRSMRAQAAQAFRSVGTQAVETFNSMRAIKWSDIGASLKSSLDSAAAGMKGRVQAMQAAASNFSVKGTAQGAGTAMQDKYQGLKAAVANNMTAAQGTFARGAGAIKQHAFEAGEAVRNMAQKFSIKGAAETAGKALEGMGKAMFNLGKAGLGAMFYTFGWLTAGHKPLATGRANAWGNAPGPDGSSFAGARGFRFCILFYSRRLSIHWLQPMGRCKGGLSPLSYP